MNPLFGVATMMMGETQHRSSARIISSASMASVASTGQAVRHSAFAQAFTTGLVHSRLRTVRFH